MFPIITFTDVVYVFGAGFLAGFAIALWLCWKLTRKEKK